MDLYAEIILDHFKNPRNFGLIKNAEIKGEDLNPLCGDKINTSLKIDTTGKIEKFGFEGVGCAISMAASSILGESLTGMTISELENLDDQKLLKMLEVPISPGRIKCALLGLSCLKKAIKIYQAEHSSPSSQHDQPENEN